MRKPKQYKEKSKVIKKTSSQCSKGYCKISVETFHISLCYFKALHTKVDIYVGAGPLTNHHQRGGKPILKKLLLLQAFL